MEKNQNIAERILFISKKENISIRALEEEIETSQGVLNKIIKNNGDIKCSLLVKILEKFPHYDALWLLTGKEKELIHDTSIVFDPNIITTNVLLDRIEKLAYENTRLRDEIERLRNQKKPYDIIVPDIAAEPELNQDKKYTKK